MNVICGVSRELVYLVVLILYSYEGAWLVNWGEDYGVFVVTYWRYLIVRDRLVWAIALLNKFTVPVVNY